MSTTTKRWSVLSLVITIGDAMLIYGLIRLFYWRGLWKIGATAHTALSIWGGIAFSLSLATAIIALVKDTSRGYALLALCLSVLSFFFYVQ